MSYCCYCWMED